MKLEALAKSIFVIPAEVLSGNPVYNILEIMDAR